MNNFQTIANLFQQKILYYKLYGISILQCRQPSLFCIILELSCTHCTCRL